MLAINYKYISKGDKTIVFLHGWGLSGNSYNKIINYLHCDVSILQIDLPGFGSSEEPRDYFDTHEYAYQIFLLLKRLKLNNIILVGHSFGGRLSILLSSVYDVKVEGVILTSSAGLNKFSLIKWLRIKRYKLCKRLVRLKILKDTYLNRFGSIDYRNASNVLRGVLSRVVVQDLGVFVKRINVHVVLVWDKKDKDTPYWICKRLHRMLVSSHVITYKNGGHFVAFKNANKFANVICDNI